MTVRRLKRVLDRDNNRYPDDFKIVIKDIFGKEWPIALDKCDWMEHKIYVTKFKDVEYADKLDAECETKAIQEETAKKKKKGLWSRLTSAFELNMEDFDK